MWYVWPVGMFIYSFIYKIPRMPSIFLDQQPTKNWVTKESINGGLIPLSTYVLGVLFSRGHCFLLNVACCFGVAFFTTKITRWPFLTFRNRGFSSILLMMFTFTPCFRGIEVSVFCSLLFRGLPLESFPGLISVSSMLRANWNKSWRDISMGSVLASSIFLI
jgi:hypothetical protein